MKNMLKETKLLLLLLRLSTFFLRIQANVEFFKHKDFQGLIYTAERITTSCETLRPFVRNKISSIKTDICINLYSDINCEEGYFTLEVGHHRSLPYFEDETNSFQACTDVSEDDPWKDLRIRFYWNADFKDLLWNPSITPNCENLPWDVRAKASSLKTDICVMLFSKPKCIGSRFKATIGSRKDLGSFSYKTASFMPCNVADVYKWALKQTGKDPTKIIEEKVVEDVEESTGETIQQQGSSEHGDFTTYDQNVPLEDCQCLNSDMALIVLLFLIVILLQFTIVVVATYLCYKISEIVNIVLKIP